MMSVVNLNRKVQSRLCCWIHESFWLVLDFSLSNVKCLDYLDSQLSAALSCGVRGRRNGGGVGSLSLWEFSTSVVLTYVQKSTYT